MADRRYVGVLLAILLVSACAWPMDRYGATRTGFNPFETVIGTDDVGDLELQLTASTGTGSDASSSPVVVNDIVIVGGADGRVYAFSAIGATNCSGSPTECSPLWTSTTGGSAVSTPALGSDTVYVGSSDGKLAAFSTSGTTNCSGSPKVCAPLWTATTGRDVSSPLIDSGVVYVTSQDDRLYAFDANGATGCGGTPTTCQPLWTAPVQATTAAPRPAAIADGVVYVTSGTTVHAFDAAGETGCSGSPRSCSPLWTAPMRSECSIGPCELSGPAVDGGTVYVGANRGDEFPLVGALYAFDAAGQVNCSGQPRTCQPEWTALTSSQFGAPAVADGVVYVTDYYFNESTFESRARLYAFDAAGVTNCASGLCSPLWRAPDIGMVPGSPSVANGVVYILNSELRAFDAAGHLGCSGVPATCTALWTSPIGTVFGSSPTIADGRVYVTDQVALHVFGLPAGTP